MGLGYANVAALEDEISRGQFQQWGVFFETEPWGSDVEFLRAGIVASAVLNSAPNRRPGSKAASPKDFMPKDPENERKANQQSLRSDFFGAFGRDAKGRKDE